MYSKVGRCSMGEELWHRVVACWNLLLKAYLSDGGHAPSLGRLTSLDVRLIPLASKAAHNPIGINKSLWTS